LKALSRGWVSSREIEAARKKITFMTKRAGKYWLRVFPHKPITSKPVGVKMGSGKGAIKEYVAVVLPGQVLIELSGVTPEVAKEAFTKAGHKLSVKTTMIVK
jgi:large subunit ribosomal protein L16